MARQLSEAELLYARSMTAIGEHAATVAHDLRNLLAGITGYAELASRRCQHDSPERSDLNKLNALVSQAKELTLQLVTVNSPPARRPVLLNLNDLIRDTASTLQRLVGENVVVNLGLDADAGAIRGHPDRIAQVLMNLATNARDAMPGGGTIRIGTSKTLRHKHCSETHESQTPEQHAILTFADTGCGMDEYTLAHLFEPFFTTKAVGKGAGIGLVAAYETVKRHGGHISVESKLGMGSRFRIYLPCAQTTDIPVSIAAS